MIQLLTVNKIKGSSVLYSYIKKFFLVSICCCCFQAFAQRDKIANPAMGSWVDHSSFEHAFALKEDNEGSFYIASKSGLFLYNPKDKILERFSKITDFSDAGFSAIGFSKKRNTLVIGYSNSNIDLVIDGRIYNISGLKEKSMQGDKAIYNISFDENSKELIKYAYFACGFGILVVDMDRKEIKETYLLGNGGNTLKVNSISFTDSLIIAATDSGLYSANKNSRFLVNYNNWRKEMDIPNPSATFQETFVFNNALFVSQKISDPDTSDSRALYTVYQSSQKGNWNNFGNFRYCKFSDEKNTTLVINTMDSVFFYDRQLSPKGFFYMSSPMVEVLLRNNTLWAACEWQGLDEYPNLDNKGGIFHCPTGPKFNSSKAVCYGDRVYIAPGGRDAHNNPRWIAPDILTYSDNTWKSLDDKSALKRYVTDVLDVIVDPNNIGHLYSPMWDGGLLEVLNNKVVNLYNEKNSTIKTRLYTEGDTAELRIAGSAFDSKGNLWVLNSMVSPNVCIRYADGSWGSLETANLIESDINLSGIMIDFYYDYKWIYPCSDRNKIYVVDGDEKQAYIDPNKGIDDAGVTDYVTALACDLDGTIWVGTNKGIKAIYNIGEVFSNVTGYESAKTCENILYESEDGKLGYLLSADYITSIAIDGANRKWVGTLNNGAYLFSPDGTKQIYHFTAEETPLPSNAVNSVSVQHSTGIVYFVTDNGIVSYKAEATEFGDEDAPVYVYPNPVRPNYDGAIAIKGLMQDAIVKITDISGNLVYNTQAYGGQAIWYGKNMSGKKVKSGVYLVFATDSENNEKIVTKILFIK